MHVHLDRVVAKMLGLREGRLPLGVAAFVRRIVGIRPDTVG